jgi:tRNA 2-selenouridine synthase
LEDHSEIIDVRSPSEYAEDHWPGAINLPVLSDQERAEIGIAYKQDPFRARQRGAALVARNIAAHLESHFIHCNRDYRPLVYCWRGGQRSHSLALVLAQVGWRVSLLQGGYKSYRSWIREQLHLLPTRFSYLLLAGPTGVGKTQVLQNLAQVGAQVLDLERLARHRGSLLGQEWQQTQPSQKWFESLIVEQLQSFQPDHPIWVESESSTIGRLHLPAPLWQAMKASPCLQLEAPIGERVRWLIRSYPHLIAHPQVLKEKLMLLKPQQGQARVRQWYDWIEAEAWEELVQDLLERHYDPAYRHALRRTYPHLLETVGLSDLSLESLCQLAQHLQQRHGRIQPPLPVSEREPLSSIGSRWG